MRELEFLDLTGNDRLSDLSPLSDLTKLRDLRLSYNAIADITPLANLTDLARLNVSYNRIGDLTPLANLTGLGILSVDGADLSDLEPLAAFGGLVYLSAGSCTRWLPRRSRCGAPPDLTSLSGLKELRTLLLHDNNISDPAPLADLPNLHALSLPDNNISDLAPLSSLARLRYLNLSGNGIFDVAPLVANAGLGEGGEIDVRGNFLAKTSVDVHIPDLEARGVDVAYDRVAADVSAGWAQDMPCTKSCTVGGITSCPLARTVRPIIGDSAAPMEYWEASTSPIWWILVTEGIPPTILLLGDGRITSVRTARSNCIWRAWHHLVTSPICGLRKTVRGCAMTMETWLRPRTENGYSRQGKLECTRSAISSRSTGRAYRVRRKRNGASARSRFC